MGRFANRRAALQLTNFQPAPRPPRCLPRCLNIKRAITTLRSQNALKTSPSVRWQAPKVPAILQMENAWRNGNTSKSPANQRAATLSGCFRGESREGPGVDNSACKTCSGTCLGREWTAAHGKSKSPLAVWKGNGPRSNQVGRLLIAASLYSPSCAWGPSSTGPRLDTTE